MKPFVFFVIPLFLFFSCRTAQKTETATGTSIAGSVQTAVAARTARSDSLYALLEGKAERIIISYPSDSAPGKLVVVQNPVWTAGTKRQTLEYSDIKTVKTEDTEISGKTNNKKVKYLRSKVFETLLFLLLLGIVLFIIRLRRKN